MLNGYSFSQVVTTIKQNLLRGLPGYAAQQRMSPSVRAGFGFPTSPNSTTRNSAVLISIYPHEEEARTILIKRTTYKGAHSGQVSFPGGKAEEFDPSIEHTALREAEEEIGIDPASVEVIGILTPLFIPVSNMLVTPVIGIMPEPAELHPNLQEVEYIIHAALAHFKDEHKLSVRTLKAGGIPISAPYYDVNNEFIWGATAMILSELTEMY